MKTIGQSVTHWVLELCTARGVGIEQAIEEAGVSRAGFFKHVQSSTPRGPTIKSVSDLVKYLDRIKPITFGEASNLARVMARR